MNCWKSVCGKYALVLKKTTFCAIFVIDFETKTFIQVQFSGNIVYSET